MRANLGAIPDVCNATQLGALQKSGGTIKISGVVNLCHHFKIAFGATATTRINMKSRRKIVAYLYEVRSFTIVASLYAKTLMQMRAETNK